MKYFFLFFIMFLVVASTITLDGCTSKVNVNAEQKLKNYYKQNANGVIAHLDNLSISYKKASSLKDLQAIFIKSRLQYKLVEPITEYYFQGLTRRINGPALPDVKVEDGVVWPPQGFQVIEQYLFDADSDKVNVNVDILNKIQVLKTDLLFTISNIEDIAFLPNHIHELLQHQFIRIATLGITGFDTPISQIALTEAESSLKSISDIANIYLPNLNNSLTEPSINFLKTNTDFNSFNRLDFLTQYLMPFSDSIYNLTFIANSNNTNTPINGGLSMLFKGKAFNADFYANYDIAKTNDAKIALGKKLFYATFLDKSNKISCATCHKPELYFTDGATKAINFIHGGALQRNTPTLLYAALQGSQFYDMRSITLEDQANEVMNNKDEFNFAASNAIKYVLKNKEYQNLFFKAFNINDSVTGFHLRNAIATYVRSLSSFNSPFDAYLNGNKAALAPEQISGFNLFMGKAKCGTCHFAPLFNGNIPPWYNKSESEIIGVPKQASFINAKIDEDSGRYKINAFAELLYSFKTPTVRNIAKTAPYMHNGVYNTLEEVITFYHKGGGVGLSIDLPFQSLPFDSLQLNVKEQNDIKQFMLSLTDKLPD